MSKYVTEPGIAIKVEVTHSEEKGYRLETRRVIGWLTTEIHNPEGDKSFTTPVVSGEVNGGTGALAVVRLYSVEQHAQLRTEVNQVNRTQLKNVASLAEAQAVMVATLAEYVQ